KGGNDDVSVVGRAVNVDATQHLASLGVDGGVVTMPAMGGTPLVVDTITLSNGGKVDLRTNSLIVRSTPAGQSAELAQTSGMIQSGGIFSSTAAGGNFTALG